MFDAKNGVITGGNYEKPDESDNNLAFTKDGGKTWTASEGLSGYRSGVAYVDAKVGDEVACCDGQRGSVVAWLRPGIGNVAAVVWGRLARFKATSVRLGQWL